MLFEGCFYLNSDFLHWKDHVLIYIFSICFWNTNMFLCELVNFQKGVEISGAKRDPVDTHRTQRTQTRLHISLLKVSKEHCCFILISYRKFEERPDNICFVFIFTGNIGWWRELRMFQGTQKCETIRNMTFNAPHLSK